MMLLSQHLLSLSLSRFGPRESKKAMKYSGIGRLNCNVSFATFSTPTRAQESHHGDLSSMLHKALEGAVLLASFPKTTVDVFALVLESGGSESSSSPPLVHRMRRSLSKPERMAAPGRASSSQAISRP